MEKSKKLTIATIVLLAVISVGCYFLMDSRELDQFGEDVIQYNALSAKGIDENKAASYLSEEEYKEQFPNGSGIGIDFALPDMGESFEHCYGMEKDTSKLQDDIVEKYTYSDLKSESYKWEAPEGGELYLEIYDYMTLGPSVWGGRDELPSRINNILAELFCEKNTEGERGQYAAIFHIYEKRYCAVYLKGTGVTEEDFLGTLRTLTEPFKKVGNAFPYKVDKNMTMQEFLRSD